MEEVIIKAKDGYELLLNVYDIKNPKAVIQVAHGMEEHQGRYKEFAKIMNDNGYAVVSADMRGHGKHAKALGFFKRKEGYKALVQDQVKITNYIKRKYPDLPLYLFSHSMGTIISRVVLQTHSKKYDKVIFSGYPNYRSAAKLGIMIADKITEEKGAKYKSELMKKLEFKFFNFLVWNPKTSVDWICYNKETVEEYLNDKYCGFGFTCSAFSDLFNLVVLMHNYKNYKRVNQTLPILFLRGADDPSTGGKIGSADSVNVMTKAGFENITKIDYEKMRHEVINEIENEIVYMDILSFLNK